MKKKVKFLILLSLGTILLIILNCNPYSALRLNLFFRGHPVSTFTSSIVESSRESQNENIKYYYFDERPLDNQGAQLGDFEVRKKGLLYIVKYWGRG
ncbi:hypothetical protein [Clostridium sp.]|uniref:hypothetical protein n=1 Tax=Clostridium sp. TaxID=1506 RepID=UPI0026313F2F|nr:hypothetical protein [Clostridium sp.]